MFDKRGFVNPSFFLPKNYFNKVLLIISICLYLNKQTKTTKMRYQVKNDECSMFENELDNYNLLQQVIDTNQDDFYTTYTFDELNFEEEEQIENILGELGL